MSTHLKCPECVESDQRSKVYSRGVFSTATGWSPFYDEDGAYHQHNPNKTTAVYSCSNGHEFSRVAPHPCPNPKCDFGKTPEQIAEQQKPQCCGGGPQWGHAWSCRALP